nr:MAG TPA: hypothetical protein [Ackermannviridae sp.]
MWYIIDESINATIEEFIIDVIIYIWYLRLLLVYSN